MGNLKVNGSIKAKSVYINEEKFVFASSENEVMLGAKKNNYQVHPLITNNDKVTVVFSDNSNWTEHLINNNKPITIDMTATTRVAVAFRDYSNSGGICVLKFDKADLKALSSINSEFPIMWCAGGAGGSAWLNLGFKFSGETLKLVDYYAGSEAWGLYIWTVSAQ